MKQLHNQKGETDKCTVIHSNGADLNILPLGNVRLSYGAENHDDRIEKHCQSSLLH